mmetsp:Transcript_108404/g.337853  ORF Transcript_108404/g.337853 Transcript_108404/m.337853 type:complete len:211 (-) Transcript_108404:39-671(-)
MPSLNMYFCAMMVAFNTLLTASAPIPPTVTMSSLCKVLAIKPAMWPTLVLPAAKMLGWSTNPGSFTEHTFSINPEVSGLSSMPGNVCFCGERAKLRPGMMSSTYLFAITTDFTALYEAMGPMTLIADDSLFRIRPATAPANFPTFDVCVATNGGADEADADAHQRWPLLLAMSPRNADNCCNGGVETACRREVTTLIAATDGLWPTQHNA